MTTKTRNPLSVPITIEIEEQRLTDMLTNALEGGSNYWYVIDKSRSSLVGRDYIVEEPMHGGTLCIMLRDEEEGPIDGKVTWLLNRLTMIEGIRTMANNEHRHFADFMNEDDDAITGDVYLQCCLFGKVVFG